MDTVIFACVHDAGRSQMAAAWFNALADPAQARAISAGTQPGERVHPVVIDAMREAGIDVSANRPQRLTEDLARGAILLVTMGCGDECPLVPGLRTDDWRSPTRRRSRSTSCGPSGTTSGSACSNCCGSAGGS